MSKSSRITLMARSGHVRSAQGRGGERRRRRVEERREDKREGEKRRDEDRGETGPLIWIGLV